RAGAALVIAGLAARGSTEIYRPYHIQRGYENMVGKMASLGADISWHDPGHSGGPQP
ncbi:MAG: UDP-N-acetylglucosamine 1-carboxyvinyltransferase, partial [Bacillota bacterium]|nr:UDP-N-acetylglucosamine 1-carboxyvinyltransferase [Bacillota bacterium]